LTKIILSLAFSLVTKFLEEKMTYLSSLIDLSGRALWRVGVATTSIDRKSPRVRIDGRVVPQRRCAFGAMYVYASTKEGARKKVERSIRANYDEIFTDISFYNTVRLSSGTRMPERSYLQGLRSR
jgi:hypothetical protein